MNSLVTKEKSWRLRSARVVKWLMDRIYRVRRSGHGLRPGFWWNDRVVQCLGCEDEKKGTVVHEGSFLFRTGGMGIVE